ncbi:MAG: Gfo/Idh/MocA family protein [Verrucomicrobiales bacterium]
MKTLSRRNFVKCSAALGSFFILPSGLRANSPNGKICTAHIGCGGKGKTDLRSLAELPNTQVIGLCDVDTLRCGKDQLLETHQSARFYQDYREMLAQLVDKVDAVSISTPDHTHYPATVAAMEMGKHVYTQKPLTHKVAEARHLMELAREKNLVTQMGIQNQSSLAYRLATSFVQSGVLGKVSRVYVWSHKNWGYDGEPYTEESAVPENLDWNLWLGTAPIRPFLEKVYVPGQWRRMLDFGCGTLGDMGVHIFDTPFRSLELKEPKWVEMECRPPTSFGHPEQNMVRYGFQPTRHTTDDFTFTWWDGEGAPRAAENPDLQLPEGKELPQQGALFVGEAGRMVLPHTAAPSFYPAELRGELVKPEGMPSAVNHYEQFTDAIEGVGTTTANFDYSAPLVEALLVGVVAAQFPGKRLKWNARKMKVTNLPEANALLAGQYRKF